MLIALFCAAVASLQLDSAHIASSLLVERRSVFLGEFPHCIGLDVSGARTLLRFGVKIDNTDDADIVLSENPALNYSIGSLSGSVPLSCLRDSRCPGGALKYFRCETTALSAGCSFISPRESKCQWIDITELGETDTTLTLSLQDHSVAFPIDTDRLPHPPRKSGQIAEAIALLLASNLLLILLPYFAYREKSESKKAV